MQHSSAEESPSTGETGEGGEREPFVFSPLVLHDSRPRPHTESPGELCKAWCTDPHRRSVQTPVFGTPHGHSGKIDLDFSRVWASGDLDIFQFLTKLKLIKEPF